MDDKDQFHREVLEAAEIITGVKDKNVIKAADELSEFSLNARNLDKQTVEGVEDFDYQTFTEGEKLFAKKQKRELDVEDLPTTEDEVMLKPKDEKDAEKLKYYEGFIDVFAKKNNVITDDLVLYLEDSLKAV